MHICSRFGANNYSDILFGKKKSNLYFFSYFTVLKEHDSSTFASEAREWPVESSYCINKHIELCLCPSVAHTDIGY